MPDSVPQPMPSTPPPREPCRTDRPLVLASTSPRRIALLREHGYDASVVAPPWEEPAWVGQRLMPRQRAEALSYFKARSVAERLAEGLVLAGDTIVALGGLVFGKPADRDDARSILTMLSGTTHQVITGVTLYDVVTRRRRIRHDITAVTMRGLSDAELEAYLDTGDWRGKAGAYGIQDSGDAFVERIEGSFSNVVGFPMELVGGMLSESWACAAGL